MNSSDVCAPPARRFYGRDGQSRAEKQRGDQPALRVRQHLHQLAHEAAADQQDHQLDDEYCD